MNHTICKSHKIYFQRDWINKLTFRKFKPPQIIQYTIHIIELIFYLQQWPTSRWSICVCTFQTGSIRSSRAPQMRPQALAKIRARDAWHMPIAKRVQRALSHLGPLARRQNASAHSLKNLHQTIDHHFYGRLDCVPRVMGHTRGPLQPPMHPPTMGLNDLNRWPRTRPQWPKPIDPPATHFKLRYGVFWKRLGTSSIFESVFLIDLIFMKFRYFMRYALAMKRPI